jgi:hypothetical protein
MPSSLFLVGLFFDREDGGDTVPPKRERTLNGIHNVTSQNTELFITTDVRV